MKENTKISNSGKNQDEEFDVKKFIYLLLQQWYWLALFGLIGIAIAFGYNKLTKPNFLVSTSILVPEKSDGLNMKNVFEGVIDMPKNNIYNQIEILKSYYTINQALINLNWRTSWYSKGLFIWSGIYNKEPFDIQEASNFVNPSGISIYISPTKGDSYNVEVNGKTFLNNEIVELKFESSGKYGQPFKNQYFNFTILKKVNNFEAPDGKYYFVFNDLNSQTLIYQKKLNVTQKDKKSDIIICSLQGEEPNKEVDFLNELTRVYTEGKMDFQNEAQRRTLNFVNSQLSGISDSLNTAGTKFSEFRSKNNIIDLGAEGTLVMNNLKDIESERAKSQMQLDYFQSLLKYLNNTSDLKQLVAPSVVGIEDVSLNSLVLKLGELYNRRQVLSFSAQENNPTLIMIDKELNQVRNRLNENLRNLIDNATRNINSQKERQDRMSVQLNKLPQKEQQMVNIQRQFNLTNEIYTFLLQKKAETNISLASSMPDVQIVDVARSESALPTGLPQNVNLIIGCIFGIFLPLAYILLINYFDNRIRTQQDIENITTIPVLGNIVHSLSKSDLAVYENPKSNIAESFRALRTNLQYMLNKSGGKIISVHSTNPGEGKSFSSVNLASILAMNNKKVVIIGADLRKPRLHKVFKMKNENGLSNYLVGIDSIDQILFPTLVENLSLIPSGPIPPNPAEILSNQEMKSLLDSLRPNFDYIIIDNAPTGMVTDGQIMSHLSDLNIFILRYGVSHKHQLKMLNEYADLKMIDNLAILVNDIKANSFGHSYYKYYQYESYQRTYYSEDENDDKKNIKLKKKLKAS